MFQDFGIQIPDIFSAKRVLAIQPHYDDNDISAGGTLARLAENGAELIYLTVTDDLAGVIHDEWDALESARQLKQEQELAGDIIGVSQHYRLGYPDAGQYNYFDLRRDIIRLIRTLKPDLIFSLDPWMLYEAHTDHLLAARATAEAALLYPFKRISSDPNVDEFYEPHPLKAVVFHSTSYPNTIMDISPVLEKKNAALRCYKAQFTDPDLELLVAKTSLFAQYQARNEPFEFGEALKIMPPELLHGVSEAFRF